MNPTIEELTDRYRNKGVLVDSNLLLLLFIGATDRKIISRFKRTQTFVEEDYDTLLAYLDCFSKRITLPNILSETFTLDVRSNPTVQMFDVIPIVRNRLPFHLIQVSLLLWDCSGL